MNVTQTRIAFSARVEAAEGDEDTIVTKNGRNVAILLGIEEYRRLRAAAGDPTDA